MEAISHFIFELVKISILGCIYATLILLTFKIIAQYKPKSWFDLISREKLRLWFLSWFSTSLALFIFMFTYWGDHGLGDSARIPIGYWRAIEETNGTQAYIQNNGRSALGIEKFIIADDYVYGLTDDINENYEGKYFVYDLADNKVITFIQENEFLNYLTAHNLNTGLEFKDFSYYYKKYWHGWRFWLLA